MITIPPTIRARGDGIPSLAEKGHTGQQSEMGDQSRQLHQFSINRSSSVAPGRFHRQPVHQYAVGMQQRTKPNCSSTRPFRSCPSGLFRALAGCSAMAYQLRLGVVLS
jgi:hypothetical protein